MSIYRGKYVEKESILVDPWDWVVGRGRGSGWRVTADGYKWLYPSGDENVLKVNYVNSVRN